MTPDPSAPMMNAGLSTHPSMAVRLRHGWKPSQATSRTGNPLIDVALAVGGQMLLPRLPAPAFNNAPVSPGTARRFGSEFYARAAGRTPLAEQLARDRMRLNGLLGFVQKELPQYQPYIDGVRTSLQDPSVRSTLGGVADIL